MLSCKCNKRNSQLVLVVNKRENAKYFSHFHIRKSGHSRAHFRVMVTLRQKNRHNFSTLKLMMDEHVTVFKISLKTSHFSFFENYPKRKNNFVNIQLFKKIVMRLFGHFQTLCNVQISKVSLRFSEPHKKSCILRSFFVSCVNLGQNVSMIIFPGIEAVLVFQWKSLHSCGHGK